MKHNKYWFKKSHIVRLFYNPISWEGWLAILLSLATVLVFAVLLFSNQDNPSLLRIGVAIVFAFIESFIFVKIAEPRCRH
ncbi:MAG: hypothetical protein ACXWLH_03140 [Candidatus Saccharimonadales bacterium]